MLKNSFYKRPQQNPTKFSGYPEQSNQPSYQVVPILTHPKNNSYQMDRNQIINGYNNYQYITPSPSPIKIQPSPINIQATPSKNNSGQIRNPTQQQQYLCKTTEKRNGHTTSLMSEKERNIINAGNEERNVQVTKREMELLERNEQLTKKLEILLKENKSLNSMIQDMGADLMETRQKLSQGCKQEGDNAVIQHIQNQSNEDLEAKIVNLTKENEKLIKMIEIQNREENSLKFLEEKIDCLLVENNKLNLLLKKEREAAMEFKRNFNRNSNLEYENKILEIKMQELQKKLEVIFDDNDKLENILKAHEVEYDDLKQKYEKEVDKNSHQITQINDLLIKIKDLKEAYKAATLEGEREKFFKIKEENKNLQEKNKVLQTKLLTLLDENTKLNECLNQILISMDEEKRIKENQEQDNMGENENLFEENQKLRRLLEEKEISENSWKHKYLELEKKIKNLF